MRSPCAGKNDAINTSKITKPVNPTAFSTPEVPPDESVPDETSQQPPLPRHQEGHRDEAEGQRGHGARPQRVAEAGQGRRAEGDREEGGDVAEDLRALLRIFRGRVRQDEAQRCEEADGEHLENAKVPPPENLSRAKNLINYTTNRL